MDHCFPPTGEKAEALAELRRLSKNHDECDDLDRPKNHDECDDLVRRVQSWYTWTSDGTQSQAYVAKAQFGTFTTTN